MVLHLSASPVPLRRSKSSTGTHDVFKSLWPEPFRSVEEYPLSLWTLAGNLEKRFAVTDLGQRCLSKGPVLVPMLLSLLLKNIKLKDENREAFWRESEGADK